MKKHTKGMMGKGKGATYHGSQPKGKATKYHGAVAKKTGKK